MTTHRYAKFAGPRLVLAVFVIGCVGVAVPLGATVASGGDSPSVRSSQSAARPLLGPAACSLVADGPLRGPRPALKAAQLWVQCNHLVTRLAFRPSKPLAAVVAEPTLYGATERDRLTCVRRSRNLGTCAGSVGADVRIRVTVRLKDRVCGSKDRRVRLETFGGIDCDLSGPPCPSIGLKTVTEDPQAYGC